MSKTAVILFNLGGPDKAESIKPFLFNFFMDKNIIRLPLPLRFFLAKLISGKRSKNEAGDSYGFLGGKSPLLENTKAQAAALEKTLGAQYRVFVCMRYWHPMADEAARAVKDYAPERIVLLPLYPQFSTTTTRSAYQNWNAAARKAGLSDVPQTLVCCYPLEGGFIDFAARKIAKAAADMREKTGKKPRILFSAHGLPEVVIKDGDPYQRQCEDTAAAVANAANIAREDWVICYQSRVGRLKWIGPSTEDEIKRAGANGVPLIIYPHAFVNEHVETLVELDIEYKHVADESGVPAYERIPVAATDDGFIAGLAGLVKEAEQKTGVINGAGGGVCCKGFRRCPQIAKGA